MRTTLALLLAIALAACTPAGYSCANGNVNSTNGNTQPANCNSDEHTESRQHADA